MKMQKNGLDEMQKERRNRIGNSMFLLLSYTLLLDAGLYGMGIRWLNYPANIVVIMAVCMSIYLVRIVAANAYLPPDAQKRKTMLVFKITVALCISAAVAAFYVFSNASTRTAGDGNDHSAIILFIVSAVGLLISLVVALIKRANDKKDADE